MEVEIKIENIIARVSKLENLVALQLLWEVDFNYIDLQLDAVSKNGNKCSMHRIQVFKPYSTISVRENIETISKIVVQSCKILNVDFYFPSPNGWDNDCPNYCEKNKHLICNDCGKPIKPKNSDFLPDEVCYSCHLVRKRNEKLVNDTLTDGERGVVSILVQKGKQIKKGYTSSRENSIEYRFLRDEAKTAFDQYPMMEIVFDRETMLRYKAYLKEEIYRQLDGLNTPEKRKRVDVSFFRKKWKTVEFDSNEYELEIYRFHNQVYRLIQTYNTVNFKSDYYRLIFCNGLRLREELILRKLYFTCEHKTVKCILDQNEWPLGVKETYKSLANLQKYGLVEVENDQILILEKGELFVKI